MTPPPTLSALVALERLREGNHRYAQNVRSVDSLVSHSRRDMASQSPVAIVLGCSDSRAPAEIVFDQGLGDLFVIRVAGNIVAPSQIGSVEFAAERFGTRLVIVMGHTHCGAIDATLEAITAPAGAALAQPAVDRQARAPRHRGARRTPSWPAIRRSCGAQAMRANVRASVNQLRHGSDIIERLAEKDNLLIVGAELDLTTGVVDFFEGVPEPPALGLLDKK